MKESAKNHVFCLSHPIINSYVERLVELKSPIRIEVVRLIFLKPIKNLLKPNFVNSLEL